MTILKTDLNALRDEIHAMAKAKGWWDSPRNTGEVLMLIISELAEALEARRKDRKANFEKFHKAQLFFKFIPFSSFQSFVFKKAFEKWIKDTDGDEIGDAFIRLLDYAGFEKFNIDSRSIATDIFIGDNFGQSLLGITGEISRMSWFINFKVNQSRINGIIDAIYILCEKEGIALHRHIQLKMRYNSTRPYKHGKKF